MSIVASIVSLVRSQVYHTEHPPLFAAHCCDAPRHVGSSATADTCVTNYIVCYFSFILA